MATKPGLKNDLDNRLLAAITDSVRCPSCDALTESKDDKFCRCCGVQINMVCFRCQKANDKYCTHCGVRRWKLFEMWRYGVLHRNPNFVLGTTLLVGSAYLLLYVWIKGRRR